MNAYDEVLFNKMETEIQKIEVAAREMEIDRQRLREALKRIIDARAATKQRIAADLDIAISNARNVL